MLDEIVSNMFIQTWLYLLAKCLGSSFRLLYDSKKPEHPDVDFCDDPNKVFFLPPAIALLVVYFRLDLPSAWEDFFSLICFRNSSILCLTFFDSFSFSLCLSCSGILTTSLVRLSVWPLRRFSTSRLRATSSSVYMTSLLSKYITLVSKLLSTVVS
jgi:hypothetical protein